VRYKLYTEDGGGDGGATEADASSDCKSSEDMDYFGFDGFCYTLTSNNNYNKTVDLGLSTCDDEFEESNETFWLDLKHPEVIRGDSDEWQSHSGNSHVPAEISVLVSIVDND